MIEAVAGLDGGDRAALLDLWVRAWVPVFPDIDFVARRDWLSGHLDALMAAGAMLLFVRREGRPVAFLTLDAASGEIDQLAVDPAHGGGGLARTLLDEAKRRAPRGLTLRVNAGNDRAIKLYRRAGFVVTGDETSARSGLPVWIMAWRGESAPIAPDRA